MTWQFNKNYHDHDQVAEFLPEFRAVLATIEAAGQYRYNDSFLGRIPGIAGPDEGRAIYLLQELDHLLVQNNTLDAYRAAGWVDFTIANLIHTTKFAGVVEWGFYMGGTGWREWADARIAPWCGGHVLLAKGKRTKGHILSGRILVRA